LKIFDQTGAFAPSLPNGGQALRRMAVRSAGTQVLSGGISLAIQIAGAMILARLLTPRDFGLVTMVTTFSMLFMNAAANGFADALLQVRDITHRMASTLFWINIAIAAVLTVAFAASGPLLATFFGETPVALIAVGLAAQVFLTALWVVHTTLLRKAMRFSALAKNDIVAKAVGVLTSIAFGLAGWGYWALVIGACALSLSTAIGVWILCPWVPGLPRRRTGARPALVFAAHMTARYSFNYVARNSDNLLVGWRFGAHALGFYKKAYDLFTLSFMQLINNNATVAVSALSRLRDDKPQYLRFVLAAIGVTALLGMGLAGDLTLIGKDLMRILLGPGWDTAGLIFTFFAPAIGIMMVNGIHGWLHVSLGRADRYLVWGIIEWVATIALFLAGLPWGPVGVAVAWGVSFWALTLPALAYAGKPVGLTMGAVFGAIWKYVAAALAAGTVAALALARISWLSGATGVSWAFARIAIDSALFLGLYLGAVILLHRGTAPLQRMGRLVRELRSRKDLAPAVSA
jgi:O-antigen/teichoic acid export membrane protein